MNCLFAQHDKWITVKKRLTYYYIALSTNNLTPICKTIRKSRQCKAQFNCNMQIRTCIYRTNVKISNMQSIRDQQYAQSVVTTMRKYGMLSSNERTLLIKSHKRYTVAFLKVISKLSQFQKHVWLIQCVWQGSANWSSTGKSFKSFTKLSNARFLIVRTPRWQHHFLGYTWTFATFAGW